MTVVVQVEGLTKYYKGLKAPAVANLSFEIKKGAIYGLLGPNGAGKTTTLSILSGLSRPSRGSVAVNGFSLPSAQNTFKKTIGVVPQEIALYPSLTLQENLRFFGRLYGLRATELESTIKEYLNLMGLEAHRYRPLKTFSGGMQRRANLIAGILHKPGLIFLDEPTVGIDVQSKAVILDYLKQLNATGTTLIYTSHHLAEAESFCDHILILDHGKRVTAGTPQELIARSGQVDNLEELFLHLTGKALRD
jgi:ABC-2 type transport system ATP-binding protein